MHGDIAKLRKYVTFIWHGGLEVRTKLCARRCIFVHVQPKNFVFGSVLAPADFILIKRFVMYALGFGMHSY